MNSRKRYVALLLCGLFLFPIGYQGIHKVLHKGFGHVDHSCCNATRYEEDSSCLASSTETFHHSTHPGTAGHLAIYTNKSHCPVCEYTFTLTTEPEPPVFMAVIPFTLIRHSFDIPEVPCSFTGFSSLLRAPPAFPFTLS